jgi:ATP-dependent Clp endopeptidase proteolytic subunit ClpP
MKKWYKIENKSDKAEIWIYEEIGEDWFSGGGVTAKGFQKELSAIKANQIDLHINSPGGSVQDGIGIYNLIKQHPANVTTYIDGWAASIASIIALAGDEVIMAENGLFMVHNPMGGTVGYSKDHRHMADVLDKVAGTLISTYMCKTQKTEDEIQALMDGDTGEGTWLSADEALQFGFIDAISEAIDMAACAKFIPIMSKAGFKYIPEWIVAKKEIPKARELERILREGGCSEQMAKSIIAGGYKGDQREVAPVVDQREVAAPITVKKDRVADLLTRAEIVAPSI